jgi:hypothetical protein
MAVRWWGTPLADAVFYLVVSALVGVIGMVMWVAGWW